jgi:hypothetical protein
LALGLGARTISYAVARGELIVVHKGVYAVGYVRVEPVARAMAAVLACGAGAVLSHESAAALWGLRRWPDIPEVTTREHRRRPGIHTHRSRTLRRADRRVELNVPTTSAGRAIADIAARLSDRQLTRATQDARRAGHLHATDLHRLLFRCPRLQQLVDPAQNPTRSGFEDVLIPWLKQHGLPLRKSTPRSTAMRSTLCTRSRRSSSSWTPGSFTRTRDSFESDRERDAHHLVHGNPTIRIIPERLTDAKAEEVRAILGA